MGPPSPLIGIGLVSWIVEEFAGADAALAAMAASSTTKAGSSWQQADDLPSRVTRRGPNDHGPHRPPREAEQDDDNGSVDMLASVSSQARKINNRPETTKAQP
jgi:hypothetical protein